MQTSVLSVSPSDFTRADHLRLKISSGWSFWSYNEEGCQDDPSWCFRNAVGTTLPSSFSSYPGAQSKSAGRSKASPSETVSPMTDGLRAAINKIAPPPLDHVLGSAINGTNSDLNSAEDTPVTPASAQKAGTQAISSNTGGLGLVRRFATWARHRSDYFAGAKRNSQSTLAVHPRNFKLSGTAGHSRQKRTPSSSEQAISLGYSEGFDTGRTFAANNLSKVGFVYQLIEDKLADHIANKDLDESKGDYYRSWFAKGLADAEALVAQAISAENPSAPDDSSSVSPSSPSDGSS